MDNRVLIYTLKSKFFLVLAFSVCVGISVQAFRANIGFFKSVTLADPYWANVTLLLRCEAGQSFDVKNHFFTNYAVSNAITHSKFGLESCEFNGSTSYLAFGDQADFNVGSGDFTVEAWVYDTTGATSGYIATASRYTGGGDGFYLGYDYTITGDQQCVGGCDEIIPSSFVPLNSWHHVAYVRNGSTLTYYIDGISKGTNTSTIDATWGNLVIGRLSPDQNSYYFTGYMEELRLTKGIARYTSNFNVPTEPFPGFAPNQLPGLALWLDASDSSTITESGGLVSQWNDKSVSALSFTQATGGAKPAYDISGTKTALPSIDFNFGSGTNKNMTAGSSLTISASHTVFMAGYWTTGFSAYSSLNIQNGTPGGCMQMGDCGDYLSFRFSSSGYDNSLQVVSGGIYYAYTGGPEFNVTSKFLGVFVSDSVAANYKMRVDRIPRNPLLYSDITTGFSVDTLGSSDNLYVSDGSMGEVLVYNRTLNSTEIKMVEEYLRNKWSTP